MLGVAPSATLYTAEPQCPCVEAQLGQGQGSSYEVRILLQKGPGMGREGPCFAFLEEEEPVRQTFGKVWGSGTR